MDNQQNQNLKHGRPKPVVLVILDGWGIAPESAGNAISQAKTSNLDKYCQGYFCTTLQASGEAVGLPYNEMGNSEVGHLNIGAGRIVYQDLPRINKSITEENFFTNSIFLNACKNTQKNNSNLHLIGLLSNGGVHASVDHLYALLELAKQQKVKPASTRGGSSTRGGKVFIHAILDGRDMAYNSGVDLIRDLQNKIKKIKIGKIATISGRWWTMDRDNRWDRTEVAYNTIVHGNGKDSFNDPIMAVEGSYKNKVYDEEFKPVVITNKAGKPLTKINNNDSVIFFNFRADRARQLTKVFTLPSFNKFDRGEYLKDLHFVTMTEYDKNLPVEVAYPAEVITHPLARIISENHLKQLHIAETEKYAHVTYFINGGREEIFEGEDHVLVPSPSVENYATTPDMSANEIKTRVMKEMSNNKYDFIVINFANPDMIAHTGDIKATVRALETVDKCVNDIVEGVLSLNGVAIITADHGNAEALINLQTGEIDKEHSTAPVPCMVIGRNFINPEHTSGKIDLTLLTPSGVLADIAPTILKIMKLKKGEDMTGRSLV